MRSEQSRHGLTAVSGINELLGDGFWYLEGPHHSYYAGSDAAHDCIKEIADGLKAAGITLFCPIVYAKQISDKIGIDPNDNSFWIGMFEPFVMRAKGIVVAGMEGWENSPGVQQAIHMFKMQGKKTLFLEPSILFPVE